MLWLLPLPLAALPWMNSRLDLEVSVNFPLSTPHPNIAEVIMCKPTDLLPRIAHLVVERQIMLHYHTSQVKTMMQPRRS